MNKQELLDKLNKLAYQRKIEGKFSSGVKTGLEVAITLVQQLDEPEVLSQEWIDEHEIYYNHWVGAVPVTDLQNLLVPKQEVAE